MVADDAARNIDWRLHSDTTGDRRLRGMGHRHLRGLGELRAAGISSLELVAACDPVETNAASFADHAETAFGTRPVGDTKRRPDRP